MLDWRHARERQDRHGQEASPEEAQNCRGLSITAAVLRNPWLREESLNI